jgi:hypothetical protein
MRVLDLRSEIFKNVHKCKRNENEFEKDRNDNELSNFDDCERSSIVLEICKLLQTIHTRVFQQSKYLIQLIKNEHYEISKSKKRTKYDEFS